MRKISSAFLIVCLIFLAGAFLSEVCQSPSAQAGFEIFNPVDPGVWVSRPRGYRIGSEINLEFILTDPNANEVTFKIWCSETNQVVIYKATARPYILPSKVLDQCSEGMNEIQATVGYSGHPFWMSYFYCLFRDDSRANADEPPFGWR